MNIKQVISNILQKKSAGFFLENRITSKKVTFRQTEETLQGENELISRNFQKCEIFRCEKFREIAT